MVEVKLSDLYKIIDDLKIAQTPTVRYSPDQLDMANEVIAIMQYQVEKVIIRVKALAGDD